MASKKAMILKSFLLKIKENKKLSATFSITLRKFFQNNLDVIEIRSDLFILNKTFFNLFVDVVGIDVGNKKTEKLYYTNFKRLKRFGLIHPRSSDYPKGKSFVSTNPNDKSLVADNFCQMDTFILSRKYVIDRMIEGDSQYLYVYLRLYHIDTINKVVLSKLRLDDLIIIDKIGKVIVYTTKKTFFAEDSSVYRLVVLDENASLFIINMSKMKNIKRGRLFDDIVEYETFVTNFQHEHLNGLHKNDIKKLNTAHNILHVSALEATLNLRRLQTVEVTLSEIETLFPGTVSQRLLQKEEQRIIETFNKKNVVEYDTVDMSLHTDILDLEGLVNILKYKKKPTLTLIDDAVNELEVYKELHKSKHAQLIYDYIIYLLNRLKSNDASKIKMKTFKNNVYILNNYIFRMIENLENIKDYEVSTITLRLESLKLNSQKTTIGILRRFFKYHEMNSNFKIDVDMVYYPKSMIFDFEIDKILFELERRYIEKNKLIKIGKNHKYNILVRQMIILIGYYLGLRRNEIRSRRKKDFSRYDNIFHIDVNHFGFKKIKGSGLKTFSAIRRVQASIVNEYHIDIISKFMNYTEVFNSDSLLFRNTTKENRIAASAMNETIFNDLNEIIKEVTQRYCTFHSLRHSFATNRVMGIIEKKVKKPYEFFDKLSTPIGHSLPEASTQYYVHWNLISLL